MNRQEALTFVKKHGVVLMAARGPVPSLAEAIAGEPIRGSWWSHPKSHHMFGVFEAVRDSKQVLVCRLVGGKITFVHRRLWPALTRLAGRLPKTCLGAVREEHTGRGQHRTVVTPFPRWVPKEVLARSKRLSFAGAASAMGADAWGKMSGLKLTEPDRRPRAMSGGAGGAGSARRAVARRGGS